MGVEGIAALLLLLLLPLPLADLGGGLDTDFPRVGGRGGGGVDEEEMAAAEVEVGCNDGGDNFSEEALLVRLLLS